MASFFVNKTLSLSLIRVTKMSKYGDKIYCKVYNLRVLDCEKNFFFLNMIYKQITMNTHIFSQFWIISENYKIHLILQFLLVWLIYQGISFITQTIWCLSITQLTKLFKLLDGLKSNLSLWMGEYGMASGGKTIRRQLHWD